MFSSVSANIVTDSSGNASVDLTHGINRAPNGFVYEIRYTPGNITNTATITITGKSTGKAILTVPTAGGSAVSWYPRAFPNAVSNNAAGTVPSELIAIKDEVINVAVSGGGNAASGSIEIILVTDPPY